VFAWHVSPNWGYAEDRLTIDACLRPSREFNDAKWLAIDIGTASAANGPSHEHAMLLDLAKQAYRQRGRQARNEYSRGRRFGYQGEANRGSSPFHGKGP
jgi:hypothetical protein